MPYAENAGVRLFYETIGDGPPLVLHHGRTLSGRDWFDFGYVERLKGTFRLIVVDARGHGQSDKPRDPSSWTWRSRAEDVTAVLDKERIRNAAFWGYSYGTGIGNALMHYAPERVGPLVLGGFNPYLKPGGTPAFLDGGNEAIVRFLEQDGQVAFTEAQRRRYMTNDIESLRAGYMAPPPEFDRVAATKEYRGSALIYCGTEDPAHDPAKKCASEMQSAGFVSLPGMRHTEGIYRGAEFMTPRVSEFLTQPPA